MILLLLLGCPPPAPVRFPPCPEPPVDSAEPVDSGGGQGPK